MKARSLLQLSKNCFLRKIFYLNEKQATNFLFFFNKVMPLTLKSNNENTICHIKL